MRTSHWKAGCTLSGGYIDWWPSFSSEPPARPDTVISVNLGSDKGNKQTKYCHICQLGIWQKHKQTEYCRHRFRVENRFVWVWVCRWSSVYFDMLRIFQSVWGRFYEYQNKWQTINKGRYAGGGCSGGKVGTCQGEKCKKMQLRNTGGGAEKCNKGAKMQAAAGRK